MDDLGVTPMFGNFHMYHIYPSSVVNRVVKLFFLSQDSQEIKRMFKDVQDILPTKYL